MSIANEIFIITKSDINILRHIKSKVASCIKIVDTARILEAFIKTGSGNCFSIGDLLLHIRRAPLLVIGQAGRETNFVGNPSPNRKASCV